MEAICHAHELRRCAGRLLRQLRDALGEPRQAVALLALALNKPRFDADAVERVRGQLLAALAYAARDPDRVASEQWNAMAFAGHPYGRPANGTPASIQKITRDDLEGLLVKRTFAKDNAEGRRGRRYRRRRAGRAARRRVRRAAGQGRAHAVPATQPTSPAKARGDRDGRAAVGGALRACRAMPRKDKDFMPAFVLNTVLGGGGYVLAAVGGGAREARPRLLRATPTSSPIKHTRSSRAASPPSNEQIAQSLDIIRAELKSIAADGPTREGAEGRQGLPDRLLSLCASTATPRSPTSCCGSGRRTSAPTTSTSATPRSRP